VSPDAAVALAGMALYLLLGERVLRRGRARDFARGPDDRHTTAVATGANALGLALPWLWALAWPPASPLAPALRAGLALTFAAGVALRVSAMRTLGDRFTRTLVVVPEQALAEHGPYRLVRHPGYLAALLVFPSYAALGASSLAAGAAALALFALAYAVRIPAEERMLERAFGERWRAYRARTARLVPWLL
jgi:protein-S-isoprenylcysteine O-methyltransferase Ste14